MAGRGMDRVCLWMSSVPAVRSLCFRAVFCMPVFKIEHESKRKGRDVCVISVVWAIVIAVVTAGIGIAVGYFYRKSYTEKKIGRTEE